MDPLSIAASTIAVVGASTQTLKLFKTIISYKHTFQLVATLDTELSDLRENALTIQSLIMGQMDKADRGDLIVLSDITVTARVAKSLRRAKEILDELQKMLQPLASLISDSDRALPMKWYILLKKDKRLGRFRQELCDIRNALNTATSILGLYVTHPYLIIDLAMNAPISPVQNTLKILVLAEARPSSSSR